MKVKLPIIGQVQTGKDTKVVDKPVEKLTVSQLSAGFVEFGNKIDYKTVDSRLLKTFEGWVYANVSALAEEVSKIDFELYRVVLRNGDIEYEEVKQHPILDLLDRFNAFTTTSQAMYNTEAHLELAGDTFYLLEGGNVANGQIDNIFILDPTKITVVPGDVSINYEIKEYIYKTQTEKGKTQEIHYTPDQVIQIKTPDPANPLRGKSVVMAAALDIDTDNLAQLTIKKFFENGAIPNVTLSTDQRLTNDDIRRLETDIRKTYAGFKNAFKTLILGNGLKPTAVQQSAKEMQFLELENAMRDKIMAMFKNTKASLGIVEDVNRANAEATLLSWKQSVIKPKMQRITDTLNEFLVPRYGDDLILTFEDPVPENHDDDIAEATDLYTNGIATRNEARAMVDLDPITGEDTFKDNGQVNPLVQDTTPKSIKNVDYIKHFRRNKIFARYEVYSTLHKEAKELILKKKKKQTKVKTVAREHAVYSNEQVWGYHEKKMHIVDNSFDNFKQKVDTFIKDIEDKSISNLHQAVGKKLKKKIVLFDEESQVQAGIDLFTPLLNDIAKLSAGETYALMNLTSGYVASETLRKRIERSVDLFVTSVVDTDKGKLSDIIENAIKEGLSIPETERNIRSVFTDFRKNQSEKVARTEVLRASNEGTLDAFRESGVVEAKQWLTAMDDRVDPECADLNGKIVELDGDFFKTEFGSGETPPLHPNCRCDLLPVLKDVRELKIEADLVKVQKKLKKKEKELKEIKDYSKKLEKIAGVDDGLPDEN